MGPLWGERNQGGEHTQGGKERDYVTKLGTGEVV